MASMKVGSFVSTSVLTLGFYAAYLWSERLKRKRHKVHDKESHFVIPLRPTLTHPDSSSYDKALRQAPPIEMLSRPESYTECKKEHTPKFHYST